MIFPDEIDTFFSSRFGSDELKRNFLAPAIAGDIVSCLGVRFVTVFVFGVFGFWCKDCQCICVNFKPYVCQ